MTTQALNLAFFVPTDAPQIGDGVRVSALNPDVTEWAALAAGGGGIADAPSDGVTYGRLNAAWAVVLTANSPVDAGTF